MLVKETEILLPDEILDSGDEITTCKIHTKPPSKMQLAYMDVLSDADKSREELMSFYGQGRDAKIKCIERIMADKKALFEEEMKELIRDKKKFAFPKQKQEYVKRYYDRIDNFKKDMNQDMERLINEINSDSESAQKETARSGKVKLAATGIVAGAHVVGEAVSTVIKKLPFIK
jgi:hypothetical protein